MQLTPEIKAQLQEQKKQCLFCKIISKEMESKIVFEDKLTLATLDIRPAVKGHTLFMLKEHYPIMPYIPPEEFKHFFGLIPQLSKSIKSAMLTTGINVFIANGGAAGQQSPHFLLHFLSREEQDSFFNFLFEKKARLDEEKKKILLHNFPLMMNNHFSRNPAEQRKSSGNRPDFLQKVYANSTVLYEDEKVLAVLPNEAVVPGHIELYSKEEEKEIERLSAESSAHLFYTASFAASLIFEGLKAHGTNIILKSGKSDDNPKGALCVHILPRTTGDRLQELVWKPKEPKYSLDDIAKRIKDQTWKIKEEKKEEVKITSSSVINSKIIKIEENKPKNPVDATKAEILAAITRVRN